MSQELKPCPFCGSNKVKDIRDAIQCQECGAMAVGDTGPRDEAWNRRAAPQAQGAGKWGPEDVIGDCWGATNDDGRIPFKVKDCKPEVQAALTSAQELESGCCKMTVIQTPKANVFQCEKCGRGWIEALSNINKVK